MDTFFFDRLLPYLEPKAMLQVTCLNKTVRRSLGAEPLYRVQELVLRDRCSDGNSVSPLVIAAANGRTDFCRYLLQFPHEAWSYECALADAAEKGTLETVCLLLDHGVDINCLDGLPLAAAVLGGHHSVAEYLFGRGADHTILLVSTYPWNGRRTLAIRT